jgi:hypothetical protein
MLLLNTVYVTVLLKEVVTIITDYCGTGREGHDGAGGTGSTDGDGVFRFEQEDYDTATGSHSGEPHAEQHESAGHALLELLGLVATLAAAFFPPVFFLFYVVPNALLDYITATRYYIPNVFRLPHQTMVGPTSSGFLVLLSSCCTNFVVVSRSSYTRARFIK